MGRKWKPTGRPRGRPRTALPVEPPIEPVRKDHFCDCSAVGVIEIRANVWVCRTCINREAYWKRTMIKPRTEQPILEPYVCHLSAYLYTDWYLPARALLIVFLLCVTSVMGQHPESFTFQQVAAVVHVVGKPMVITAGITNFVATVPRKDFNRLNDVRKVQSKPFYSWKEFQSNPQINREYVTEFLNLLQSEMKQEMGVKPTCDQVFGAYKFGLKKFRSMNWDWGRVKDRPAIFKLWVFREFCRNPVLCEEPLPPLSVPMPQGVAKNRGR